MKDVEFLALLVHRGKLSRPQAQGLVPQLQAGGNLCELLHTQLGWPVDLVDKLLRTRCGEIPEIPGYDLLGKCGTGGTADVFKVREKKTNRLMALKVLKPECTRVAGTRKAFIHEARLLERLRHPGLVRCYGVARSGNTFFSRLEFVDGATALELLDANGAFTEEEALNTTLAAAEVLHYLEENGVVHRDVKPGNIMIDRKGRVVLIDLGFAAEGDEASPEDSTMGTVAYLSPEQARGGASADTRSDIYSLGISLFHFVVGHLPFEGSDDQDVLRMQVMDSLSSPKLKGRALSNHLHYFIEKMVAKDVGHRYQNWSELIADIKEQLAGRDDLDFRRGDGGGRRGRRHS